MRYYMITHRTTNRTAIDIVIANSEASALDGMTRDDGEILVTPLCGVGDRVEGGDTPEDYDTGRVLAIGETVYELAPSAREHGVLWPVLVAWDSGIRTVEEALALRAEGDAPPEMREETSATV